MVNGQRRSSIPLRREDIPVSDRELASRYLGIKTIPCVLQSPLREDDVNPSFAMRERDGVVFWKDFGTGESGSIVTLLAKLWGVTYQEALLKLSVDNKSRIPASSLIRRYKGSVRSITDSELKVKVREWKDLDKEYWESYGIPLKVCKWANIHPISHAFFIHKDSGITKTTCIPMDKYAYAYFEWKDGKQSIKIYQPYSATMKWLSKHDSSVWDLWKQAFQWAEMDNSKVILTSSRKDALCLWSNLGIPAMALQGEGYIPKPQVMKQVLDRFRKVYIWYDNDFSHSSDNPGQDNAKKLCEAYPELINVCIPECYKCKDPSDLYKTYGNNAKAILNEIIESADNTSEL